MREILFRGKLLKNRQWSYGNLNIEQNGVVIITPDKTPLGKYGQVDAESVGQYTGLTVNGTKIFEGDIVREKDVIHDGEKYVVEFRKGCWIIRAEDDCWDFLYPQDNLKVIGNIHDNPELLKGRDEK